MALDTPGIPIDTFANPISWSEDNYIAVTCNDGVYYQNLETKIVQRLPTDRSLQVLSLKWAGKSQSHLLAIGTNEGTVQVWHTAMDERPKKTTWMFVGKMGMLVLRAWTGMRVF